MTEHFFASCPRGLEVPLVAELTTLQASTIVAAEGGVAFSGSVDLVLAVNLESRIASRVLWRVGEGPYRDEEDLYRLVREIEWPRHFRNDRTLRVDVAATRSPVTSLEFVTLRVKDAVCDRFRDATGTRPSVDKQQPDVRVHLHLTSDRATVYLDTSGEPLFKRGYRRSTDEAPLRENLAAGILALADWDPAAALLDPMCGGGTLAIEAALRAANMAPGQNRSFGFQKLAWYDGPTWQRLRQRARDRVASPPQARSIFASDVSATAVSQAVANAQAAGVADWIETAVADVLERAAPAPAGTLVANPPYGVRLDDAATLAAFYPRLGDALKQHYAGWTAFLFTADLRLPKLIGLKPSARRPLWNGALECRLYRFEMTRGRPPRHAAAGGT